VDKMKPFLLSLGLILFHVLIFPAISILIVLHYKLDDTIFAQIIYLVNYILLAISLFWIFNKNIKADTIEYKKKLNLVTIKYYLMMIASTSILILLSRSIGSNIPDNEKYAREYILNYPVIRSIITIIFVPFIEELIYRFSIRKFININWLFIVFSSLIFGLLHVPNLFVNIETFVFFLTYTVSGIFIAHLYVKTGNIWSAILLHFMNNAFSVILLLV